MPQQTIHDPEWSADDLHGLADVVAAVAPSPLPVEMLDQLEALQRVKAAAAAAQVQLAASFAEIAEREDEARSRSARRTPPRAMSLGAEVALAVHTSPYRGEQRVLLSRRLRDDLPQTLAALARGELTEERAFAVAREVGHLAPEQRTRVDDDLAPHVAGLGDVALRQRVRRLCLVHAAEAEDRRYRRARADRRVTLQRLDDGTGRLAAILPREQAATVRAALDQAATAARAAGDARTAGQVRADVLVGRVTGHDPATPMPVKIDLVIGIESLLGEGVEPGRIKGGGFLPAALCTRLVREASAAAKVALRRLFASPDERALVAMESTSRRFDGLLGELLDVRDGDTCRTPWCDATIRHRDHVRAVADDGPTAADNGQGLCERCNYVKEAPGWTSWVPDHPPGGRHEVHGVTEHLRLHRSTAPPLPGGPAGAPAHSPAEHVLAQFLTLAS